MLGWWITVFSDAYRQEPHLIASWGCGVFSADWLNELCQAGHAEQTENKGGYPNVYQTQAKHVAPWLLDGKISPQGDAPHGNRFSGSLIKQPASDGISLIMGST